MKRHWAKNWVKAACPLLLAAGITLLEGLALAGFGSGKAVAQLGAASSGGAAAITSTVSPSELQDGVAQMMKDHMGLTTEQADDWASAMVEHVQAVHGDLWARRPGDADAATDKLAARHEGRARQSPALMSLLGRTDV